MKGVIIFTIILVAIVLGHDAWISYDKDLQFALSDFGWVINTYIPEAEPYILENTSEYIQTFISSLFKMTSLLVVLCFTGFLFILSAFVTLSDKMGDLKVMDSKGKKSGSLLKRDREKKMQYKRK